MGVAVMKRSIRRMKVTISVERRKKWEVKQCCEKKGNNISETKGEISTKKIK
jgi:hypothetical protein